MVRWGLAAAIAGIVMISSILGAHAQTSGSQASGSPLAMGQAGGGAGQGGIPQKGFFAGAGAAVNFSSFPDQNLFGMGLQDMYLGSTLYTQGAAGGSTSPSLSGQTSVAPMLQLGYYDHFAGSNWLWGAKFTYNYLNASSNRDNVLIPQSGSYTGAQTGHLSGNIYVRSYGMEAHNQFALVPFLGYAFNRGFVYLGVGPTLTQMTSEISGVIGFANLNGTTDLTGLPANYSSTNWVWGATVSTGATYFFAKDWFVDVNYTYTASASPANRWGAPFSRTYEGYTSTGLLFGTYSGSADVQAVMVSINKMF